MLRLGLLLFSLLLAGPSLAGQQANIRLSAPPVVQALPLLRTASDTAGNTAGIKMEFLPWRSPEQLRALVASRGVDAVIATLPTAAVLAARGIPCKVLAVYSAPLWIMAAGAEADQGKSVSLRQAFQSLEGREIMLPFGPGDMPEMILAVLARQCGVELAFRHSGSSLEAANMLRLGRGKYALLAEPAASWLVGKAADQAGSQSVAINKLLNLSALWAEVFPDRTDLATAALVMVGDKANDSAACAAVRSGFVKGWNWTGQNQAKGIALAQQAYPALGKQLATSGEASDELLRDSVLLTGSAGKQAAEFVLERLYELRPASVGGRLPDAGFWGLEDAVQ